MRTGRTTVPRTCPLCEAGCGLAVTVRDGAVTRIRGDMRRRLQPRLHLPEGLDAPAAPRRPRPAAPAAGQARRPIRGGEWEEAWQGSPTGSRPVIDEHGRGQPRGLRRQPERPQPRRAALQPGRSSRRWARATCSRRRTVDQRPKEISSALVFGAALTDAGARPRPHRPPADPRRQPVRLQRQPRHRARLARAASRRCRPAAARLVVVDPRRSRTAEEADRARAHPARAPTRCLLAAMVQVLVADDLVDLGHGRRRTSPASTRSAAAVAPFTPEARRGRDRHRRRRRSAGWPTSWPTRRPAAVYGRIGTTTSPSSAPSPRGWSTSLNICTGNLDRPGGAMFTTAGGRRDQHPGHAAVRPGHPRSVAGTSRVRGLPETFGEFPAAVHGRGDRHARARARSGRWSPSPATRSCRRPNCGRLDAAFAGLDFMVAVDIYLNETTRHADVILPPPVAAAEEPLRPGAPPARHPQRGQLLPAGAPARRRASPTSGRSWPSLALIAPGRRAPTPTRRWSTT